MYRSIVHQIGAVLVVGLALGACAGPDPIITPGPVEEEPAAVGAARVALAEELGVDAGTIAVTLWESVNWPDACLGVPDPLELCAAVVTPGYRVFLELQGTEYEYHTNQDGTSVRLAPAAPPAAVDPVIVWHVEGGIAGFCDTIEIYSDGLAVASRCGDTGTVEVGRTYLSEDQFTQLRGWQERFESFDYEQSDPAVADAMTVRLVFSGLGTGTASQADQQAMIDLAWELFGQIGV